MKRNALLSVLALLLVTVAGAYAKTVSVHVTEPGTFAEELAKQCDWATVDTLTVSGQINADDVRQIRKMANGMDIKMASYITTTRIESVSRISKTDGNLVKVDLNDATFTADFEKFLFYYNDAKEIILPKQYKTRSVKFANLAFYNSKIETIGNFPENVLCIGDSAFKHCENLKRLDWKNVATIGNAAFYGTSMKVDKFPENLTQINSGAFAGPNIVIIAPFPASLTYIGSDAFRDCTLPSEINLTDVRLNSYRNGPSYVSCFYGTKGVKSITLTYTTPISDFIAFDNMEELETVKVTAPKGSIQVDFRECHSLKNVHIPNLGNFFYCYGAPLSEVYFDNSTYTPGTQYFETLYDWDLKYYGPDYDSTTYGLATLNGALYKFAYDHDSKKDVSDLMILPSGTSSYTSPPRCCYVKSKAFKFCGDLEYLKLTEANIDNGTLYSHFKNAIIEIPDDNPYLRKGENGFIYHKGNYGQESIMFATSDVQSSKTLVIDAPIYDYNSLARKFPELTKVIVKQNVKDVTNLFPNAINLKQIEFESSTPPDVNDLDDTLTKMQEHAYDDDYFIIVPKGSEMNYMNHPFWYRFIVKSSDSVADISSDEMNVQVDGRMVRIAGIDEKESVEVVNACGQIVHSGAEHEIALPSAGLYVVRAGSHVRKVIAR